MSGMSRQLKNDSAHQAVRRPVLFVWGSVEVSMLLRIAVMLPLVIHFNTLKHSLLFAVRIDNATECNVSKMASERPRALTPNGRLKTSVTETARREHADKEGRH